MKSWGRIFSICTAAAVLMHFVFGGACAAELSLKRKVIENCPEALAEVHSVKDSERSELIEYLILVLKLQAKSAPLPGPLAAGKAINPPEPWSDSISQTLDPGRELEAKRCAVELLHLLAPHAVDALPEMLVASQDPLLPPDFSEQLEETALFVAANAARDSAAAVSTDILKRLTDLFLESNSYVVGSVIYELQKDSVKYLIGRLNGASAAHWAAISSLLLEVDSAGEIIASPLMALLNAGSAEQRDRLLGLLAQLPAVYGQVLPLVIERINDPQAAVSSDVSGALKAMVADEKSMLMTSFSEKMIGTLASALRLVSGPDRDAVEKALIAAARSSKDFVSHGLSLVCDPDNDIRRRAVGLLGQIGSPTDAVFGVLLKALYDPAPEVRYAAIEGLARLESRKGEIISAFSRLLKSGSMEGDAALRQRILVEIASALTALRAEKAAAHFAPYLVEALAASDVDVRKMFAARSFEYGGQEAFADGFSHPAVAVLIAMGQNAVSPCIKALRSADPIVREHAALVLSSIRPLWTRTVAALVGLLRDDVARVRLAAKMALIKCGKQAAIEVRRALHWDQMQAKLAAAQVLAELGEGDELLAPILKAGVAEAPCVDKCDSARALRRIWPSVSFEQIKEIVKCLVDDPAAEDRAIETLVNLVPLDGESRQALLAASKADGLRQEARVKILSQAELLGLGESEVLPLYMGMLSEQDAAIRIFALRNLAELKESGRSAVPLLLQLEKQVETDRALHNEVLLALNKLEPSAFDLKGFIVARLESDSAAEIRPLLFSLEPPLLLSAAGQVWGGIGLNSRVALVEALAKSGFEAEAMAPQLVELLGGKSSALRYHALVALLWIKPNMPQVLPALRRVLSGPLGRLLHREALPGKAIPVFEAAAAQAGSHLERRNASIVLSRIKREHVPAKPSGICPL